MKSWINIKELKLLNIPIFDLLNRKIFNISSDKRKQELGTDLGQADAAVGRPTTCWARLLTGLPVCIPGTWGAVWSWCELYDPFPYFCLDLYHWFEYSEIKITAGLKFDVKSSFKFSHNQCLHFFNPFNNWEYNQLVDCCLQLE